jgi:hypothetical protein
MVVAPTAPQGVKVSEVRLEFPKSIGPFEWVIVMLFYAPVRGEGGEGAMGLHRA